MRSATRGLLEVAVMVLYVDEPLFSSNILIAFVYAMTIFMSENTHNMYTRGEGG